METAAKRGSLQLAQAWKNVLTAELGCVLCQVCNTLFYNVQMHKAFKHSVAGFKLILYKKSDHSISLCDCIHTNLYK